MIDADLSVEVLIALSDKVYPRLHALGEPCPFLRYYHPMELSDLYYEEEKDNDTDTTKELEQSSKR